MISLKSARRAGVPLIVIETTDNKQTQTTLLKELNGRAETCPIVSYDLGCGAVAVNEVGGKFLNAATGGEELTTIKPNVLLSCLSNPDLLETLRAAKPARTPAYIFMHNPQLIWSPNTNGYIYIIQAIWNLRNAFEPSGSQLIMLVPVGTQLPAEFRNDVVVLKDTLPTLDEVETIIQQIAASVADKSPDLLKQIKDNSARITDALLGLPAFAVKQTLALSITKTGIDSEELWNRKRQAIEQTKGLTVWRGGETFADVGGYEQAKKFMQQICSGEDAPRAVVFIDEIEKVMGGVTSDNTGVTQDQLRGLLTFMQDHDTLGVIFIGPPGSGKSAVAKAAGNDAGIPTINLDLGGVKGSLVGESEQQLRKALDVILSISQGKVIFIATCNSIGVLPIELRRRFSLGTFYFPLPSETARAAIWAVYARKFPQVNFRKLPNNDGWTGDEIRRCVRLAAKLKITLIEAAAYIVPVSISAATQIEDLNKSANGRYLNAEAPGLYEYKPAARKAQAANVRSLNLSEEDN